MKVSLFVVFVLIISTLTIAAEKIRTINVSGPTIIAFFPPITQKEIDKDNDTSEALDDFQWHLRQVKQKLEQAGVAVHEIYVRKFEIVTCKKKKIFKPGEIHVGYYFAKPGKLPKVQYGVMSDIDIVDAAAEYFALPKLLDNR